MQVPDAAWQTCFTGDAYTGFNTTAQSYPTIAEPSWQAARFSGACVATTLDQLHLGILFRWAVGPADGAESDRFSKIDENVSCAAD